MSPNWKQLIEELRAVGMGVEQIADAAKCSKSMVNQLAGGSRGARLSYSIGAALVVLHKQKCLVSSSAPSA